MREPRVCSVFLGFVVGSLLLVPATALAKARVGIADNSPQIYVVRGDDEPDRVRATSDNDAGAFVFTGVGGTTVESTGTPCAERSETKVTCPADGIKGLLFRLGAGNDRLRVRDVGTSRLSGGDGRDRIHASGRGSDHLVGGDGDHALTARGRQGDRLTGGSGDDVLRTRGGGSDRARCGKGADIVIADSKDIVSADCETVTRS